MAWARESALGETPRCVALSHSTSFTESRQRRQRFVISFSGTARSAAIWP